MTKSETARAVNPVELRMQDILSLPAMGPQATLAALTEAKLVPPAGGYKVRTFHPVADIIHRRAIELAPSPMVHLSPDAPFKADGARRTYVYATDTTVSTWPKPSYYRVRSSPANQPYLLILFSDWPAGQQLTVTLDMRVNKGTVRIAGSSTPWQLHVTRGGRVHPEIKMTPTDPGFGSVLIGRLPDDDREYGFYWYGLDVN